MHLRIRKPDPFTTLVVTCIDVTSQMKPTLAFINLQIVRYVITIFLKKLQMWYKMHGWNYYYCVNKKDVE